MPDIIFSRLLIYPKVIFIASESCISVRCSNIKATSKIRENVCKLHTDKGLISRIYKELKTLNHNKANNPVKKWTKDMDRHFSIDEMQMTNRYIRSLGSLAIRLMKIKNTIMSHLSPVRMASTQKSKNS